MTECERLISEGFITEGFLKEENRDGYIVSHEMKKNWAIYLDLLRVIIEICDQHKLRYWVEGGTMLGAVRHKGFIPWDDDIDVCMPRDDYNRLLALELNLPEPYFMRTPVTDHEYYYSFACICNCNTTSIGIMGKNNCHKCMAVSIIPIDGVAKNEIIQRMRFWYSKVLSVVGHAYAYNVNPNIITKIINRTLHLPIFHFDLIKLFHYSNRIASITNWEKAEKVGNLIYSPYKYERNVRSKDNYNETIYMPFEHMLVAVPAGYDGILKSLYGDYMSLPPESERICHHMDDTDPDTPYVQ